MTAAPAEDLPSELAAWIGRESVRADMISPRMAESFSATLAPQLAAQPDAPLGVHWCLAPDIVAPEHLGPDGHPRTGIFLPALPYPRRMWAGGALRFRDCFGVGDMVVKTSTLADIAFKTGKTGRLAFVTVRHAYRVGDRLMLEERQDIVYRDAEGSGSQPRPPAQAEAGVPPARQRDVITDPTLLFRYSALTFNGHRIHYDRPYATEIEGYAGLVVHGPIQATWLLNLAAEVLGEIPGEFSYRGQAPLICGAPARVEAREGADLSLRVIDSSGVVTMVAEARLP